MKRHINKTIYGTQQEALERGIRYRKRLTKVISKICETSVSNNYQHLYVYGPAGIGKTYLVKKQLEESGVKHYLVSGANSIYTLGVFLAFLQSYNIER
jgi:predicted ATPase